MQLGVEALATLAIALTASFQIGAGDAHPAGTFFALPERRLVSLGAIAFLSVFAEASVNDWSALYLSAGVGMTPGAAPRIRDLADRRLYVADARAAYKTLAAVVGGTIDLRIIADNWEEILRLAASIKAGTVLRRLAAYPRQNALAKALREIGRLERTLFTLDWISDPTLRRRANAGLNKGEARNALARAVFFHRLGEIRDRTFENQRYRASGLNLAVAAIILWNTVYLGRAVDELRSRGEMISDELLSHLAPLGWEHIAFNGDYVWPAEPLGNAFRPLRA